MGTSSTKTRRQSVHPSGHDNVETIEVHSGRTIGGNASNNTTQNDIHRTKGGQR